MTHTEKHEFGQSLEADLDHVRREAMRGHESDAPAFVPQPAPNIGARLDAEIAAWNWQRASQQTGATTMNQTKPAPFGVEERLLVIALADELAQVWRHLVARGLIAEGEARAEVAQGIGIALRNLADVPADED
jgi:hypothetical protein